MDSTLSVSDLCSANLVESRRLFRRCKFLALPIISRNTTTHHTRVNKAPDRSWNISSEYQIMFWICFENLNLLWYYEQSRWICSECHYCCQLLNMLKVLGPISQTVDFYLNDMLSPKKSWFQISAKSVKPFWYMKKLCNCNFLYLILCKLYYGYHE